MHNDNELHSHHALRKRRRELRKNLTPSEAALWQMLRKRKLEGRKFRRQHSIGPYIVDFFCYEENLAIELDGAPHDDPTRADYDGERTAFLNEQGVQVIRFENRDVFEQPDVVLDAIAHCFD